MTFGRRARALERGLAAVRPARRRAPRPRRRRRVDSAGCRYSAPRVTLNCASDETKVVKTAFIETSN